MQMMLQLFIFILSDPPTTVWQYPKEKLCFGHGFPYKVMIFIVVETMIILNG